MPNQPPPARPVHSLGIIGAESLAWRSPEGEVRAPGASELRDGAAATERRRIGKIPKRTGRPALAPGPTRRSYPLINRTKLTDWFNCTQTAQGRRQRERGRGRWGHSAAFAAAVLPLYPEPSKARSPRGLITLVTHSVARQSGRARGPGSPRQQGQGGDRGTSGLVPSAAFEPGQQQRKLHGQPEQQAAAASGE